MNKDIYKAKGVAYYACVHSINRMSGKYSVELAVDEKTSGELTKLGLSPIKDKEGKAKQSPDGKALFKFKRNPTLPDGTEMKKPKVYGEDGHLTDDLVGNGSEVIVAFKVYSGKLKSGGTYTSTNLLGLKVQKLVKYEKTALFDDVVDEYNEATEKDTDDEFTF